MGYPIHPERFSLDRGSHGLFDRPASRKYFFLGHSFYSPELSLAPGGKVSPKLFRKFLTDLNRRRLNGEVIWRLLVCLDSFLGLAVILFQMPEPPRVNRFQTKKQPACLSYLLG